MDHLESFKSVVSNRSKKSLAYLQRSISQLSQLYNHYSPQKKKPPIKKVVIPPASPLKSALKQATPLFAIRLYKNSNRKTTPRKVVVVNNLLDRHSPELYNDDDEETPIGVSFAPTNEITEYDKDDVDDRMFWLQHSIKILSTLIGITLLLGSITMLILAISHPHVLVLLFGASALTTSGILAIKVASGLVLGIEVVACSGLCFFKLNHLPVKSFLLYINAEDPDNEDTESSEQNQSSFQYDH